MLPAIAAEWGLSVFSLTRWRIRAALTVLGMRTAMSGGDDTGLGPCATSAPL